MVNVMVDNSGVKIKIQLGFGCWVLGVGFWVLAFGCWLLAIGCWLLAVSCWVLAIGFGPHYIGIETWERIHLGVPLSCAPGQTHGSCFRYSPSNARAASGSNMPLNHSRGVSCGKHRAIE